MISDTSINTTINLKITECRYHLVLLGCGKMGSALLKGWLQRKDLFARISVIEPANIVSDFEATDLINRYTSIGSFMDINNMSIDFVVFAVKPQMMAKVIAPFSHKSLQNAVFLSIAAGLSAKWFEERLSGSKQIVRAMPNIPASVGAGITAVYISDAIPEQKKEFCITLLEVVGETVILPDEKMMDAVTALSGSGPAYVFLLAEAMQIAGVQLGLPEILSKKLARGTVYGAGALLARETADSAVLRENVTSKGGTTAAALSVLMEKNCLAELILKAMQLAQQRSRELGE
mgnify:CR=1 FL=1